MSESATENCIKSIQCLNEDLFKISGNTLLSSDRLKDISSSVKAEWIGEDNEKKEKERSFHQRFKEYQVDEKVDNVKNVNRADLPGKTEHRKNLLERKAYMEKEIHKIREEQANLDSAIHQILNSKANSFLKFKIEQNP